jgi:hypothetical protein
MHALALLLMALPAAASSALAFDPAAYARASSWEVSSAEVRALIGATGASASAPTLLYLWQGFVLPSPVNLARDSSAAFGVATGLDLRLPASSMAGGAAGQGFLLSTARGGATPELAARDSSAPASVYLASNFVLPRGGSRGDLASSAFSAILWDFHGDGRQ